MANRKCRVPQPHEWDLTQRCTRCREVKPWAEFSPKGYATDGSVLGVQSQCQACRADANRRKRIEMRKWHTPRPGCEHIPEPWEYIKTRTCTKCGLTKTFASFSPKSYFPDGTISSVQSYCKKCATAGRDRKKQLEWRRRNRDRVNAKNVIYLRNKRAGMRKDRTSQGRKIPVGPFVLWLLEIEKEEGSLWKLSEDAGLHRDSLKMVLHRNKRVSEKTVEAAACARGLRFDDIYRDFEEAAA